MARISTILVVTAVIAVGLAFAPAAVAQDDTEQAPDDGLDAVPDDPGAENGTDDGDVDVPDSNETDDDVDVPDRNDSDDVDVPDPNETDDDVDVPDRNDSDADANRTTPDLPEQAHHCAQAALGDYACDLDGDGNYSDVDADGAVGQSDVAEFFENQHREEFKQPELFDFSGNGEVTHGDVVELFDQVALQ